MNKITAILIGAMSCFAIIYYTYQHITQVNTNEKVEDIMKNGLHEGNALFKKGEYQQALNSYQKVLSILPDHQPSLINSAHCYQKLGNINNAIDCLVKVTELNPNHRAIRLHLGELYASQETDESYTQAIKHFSAIMALEPRNEHVLLYLGEALVMTGNSEKAIEVYKKLLALNPTSSDAHVAMGKAYERINKMEIAKEYYQKAIDLNPDNPYAHISLAGAYWALGNYKDGFQEYEWRWQNSNMKNTRRWDGSDPKGKIILLLGESGLGDIIQFVRFAKSVKERGATVYMAVSKPLVKILAENEYIDKVVPEGDKVPPFHALTSIQSVAALLNTTMETLPKKPYMNANEKLIEYWSEKLKNDHNFKIGLCWQAAGFKGHVPQGRRSINLKEFAPLAEINGVSLYSLQKGEGLNQLSQLPSHVNIVNFEELDTEHGPFMDTAALMKNLDLIITVDTSIAHLAGALGVPTLTLLPFHPDPRWMYDRPDTPWYPSMTLVRQPQPGNWQSAIQEAVTLVKQKMNKNLTI